MVGFNSYPNRSAASRPTTLPIKGRDIVLVTVLLATAAIAAPADPPSPHRQLQPGVWLVEGGMREGRQPDGNSVILAGRTGLIVFDTGRHDWHRRGIEAVLAEQHRKPVAIFNSHWHLDHVIGDIELRRQYPGVKVYASNAIDRALGGFLARGAEQNRQIVDGAKSRSPGELEDATLGIFAVENGGRLKPDVVIDHDQTLTIDGRRLEVHLAVDAATDGDVWLYDPASRTAIVGDLITIPAPFLDTACSEGWRKGLQAVAKTPFKTVVPGHGRPLNRAEFETYRTAFSALLDCARSNLEAKVCVAAWTGAVTPLFSAASDRADSDSMTGYYVAEVLRKNAGDSAGCRTRAPKPG
jgi:glyoxylase-like metal-dependent hydrolase (beta-lactamase superfamily II)